MFLRRALGVLILGLPMASAGAALAAADKPTPTPSAEAAPKKEAEPVSGDPQMTTATYGDWVERCQRVSISGEARRLCEVALTVVASGQSAPLAELAVGRAKKGSPLRLTLVLPVNVGFPSAPKITAEGGEAMELAWRRCLPAGCFAETAFGADAQRIFRAAKSAQVQSKSAANTEFNFAISMRGLPQALDALAKEP